MNCAGHKFDKKHIHSEVCEGWARLKQGDDWGFKYWAIEPLDKSIWPSGMSDHRRGINFEWPGVDPVTVYVNGRELNATVSILEKEVRISDMGHDYTTSTQVIRFVVDNDREYKPNEVLVKRTWAENAQKFL